MKRDIFYQEEPAQQKRLTKAADFNKSEIKNVICHDTPEVSVANDPTKNRIKKEDLLQKKTLTGFAKVYSARRNESAVTF